MKSTIKREVMELLNPFQAMCNVLNNTLEKFDDNPFDDKTELMHEAYREEADKLKKRLKDYMVETTLKEDTNIMYEVNKILNPPTDDKE
jgi:hypothetical protein